MAWYVVIEKALRVISGMFLGFMGMVFFVMGAMKIVKIGITEITDVVVALLTVSLVPFVCAIGMLVILAPLFKREES